ncbi:MAG: ABC transporter ATP-binding protein [Rhodobacteraceae bacterium]|nr:ABC transporter ATP-binding protein [Paracoccaceae bacterium]
MPLLSVDSLQVRYGAVEAVRGIGFEIHPGEIVAFLGANGAGKSSTLNALAGLVPVASGRVVFDGTDITHHAPERLAPMGMTLTPEGRRIFGTLTVEENLRMGAYGVSDRAEMDAAWARVYELFPILFERRSQYAGTLSGGQQQMLAVGRSLMSNPRLLLLDEPSLGLAPKIVEQIFELIGVLRDQGVTLVVVEQNVAMALEIADRGYVMSGGRIVSSGTAGDLSQADRLQAAYLGAE